MIATQEYTTLCTWRGTTVQLFPLRAEFSCYLIHFDIPYRHARHYLGASSCYRTRLASHRAGTGARLMEVIAEHDIDWSLARLWPCESAEEMYQLEHQLKGRHSGVKLCPICQHKPLDAQTLLYHGHYPFDLFKGTGKRRPMPR
jgi:predicted GIY-YIG superfamily endonuclease